VINLSLSLSSTIKILGVFSCFEDVKKKIRISSEMTEYLLNRGVSNYVTRNRCFIHAIVNCVYFLKHLKYLFRSVNDGQSNRFKTIVAFDCRGLEPIDFSPRNGWTVKGFKVLFSHIAVRTSEKNKFDHMLVIPSCSIKFLSALLIVVAED